MPNKRVVIVDFRSETRGDLVLDPDPVVGNLRAMFLGADVSVVDDDIQLDKVDPDVVIFVIVGQMTLHAAAYKSRHPETTVVVLADSTPTDLMVMKQDWMTREVVEDILSQ